jgi:RNA polymerase sigma-70 factor (ECF subfamily)
MLGSLDDADDAIQEAWLRLSKSDADALANLGGWLTTVVSRICLDMLRARKSRQEGPLPPDHTQLGIAPDTATGVEDEAQLADSVGLALLVVLDTLEPAERLAFVLHDMFDLPFEDIAPIVGRSSAAARQLASRARRRVRGLSQLPETDLSRQREVVSAFLAAARSGNVGALLDVLDPDVVRRADAVAVPDEGLRVLRGARKVAQGAAAVASRSVGAQLMLVNGAIGIVVAPLGKVRAVLEFEIAGDKIVEIRVTAHPEKLRQLQLSVLEE